MDTLRLGASVVLAPASDGYIAYDIQTERLHQLNAIASLIVELCDGTRDGAAIRDVILPIVGESGWPDCEAWIQASLEQGLLRQGVEPPEGKPVPGGAEMESLIAELREDDKVLEAFVCQYHLAELAPDVPRNWYLLGDLAQANGRRDDARYAYERYIELRPENAEIAHILIALREETPPERGSDEYIEYLFERFAADYDRNMCEDLGYNAPALIYEAIVPALGDCGDLAILDLGCGTGLSGVPFRSRARTLSGVDLSAGMVAKARERAIYDHLHVAEITAFLATSTDQSYDVIVSCDTFIYFGDLEQAVAPAARLLSEAGLLAFTVEKSTVAPFKLTDSGRFAHHPDHVSEVVTAAGLTVVSMSDVVLRQEYGEPVQGIVTIARKW